MSGPKEVLHAWVFVDKVHAPVRDARNPFTVSFANEGQEVWGAVLKESTPIVISLANTTTFIVQLTFTTACYGLEVKLTGSVTSSPGVTFSGQTFTIGQSAGTIDSGCYIENIPVKIQGPSNVVPWGFSDEVVWTLEGDSADITVQADYPLKSKLSVYALVDDLAPYFHEEGIPLQFLEFMVQPTMAANPKLTTQDEWVSWIVWRCFASKVDTGLEKKSHDKWSEAIHSYRYNAFLNGSSNFFFDAGRTFDLDQWLLNSNPPAAGQWYGVNCYDQSALLQTALSLGVPYHYVDSDNNRVSDPDNGDELLQTIGKLYRDPFGYITPRDLIGWGDSDSPIFLDGAQKTTGGLQDPSQRESFGRHAWVYIRNSNTDPDDVSALDACAGPGATLVSIDSYLSTVVDVQATEDDTKSFPNFDNSKKPSKFNGVASIVVDRPIARWEKHTFMGDSMPRLRCDGKTILYVWNDGAGAALKTVLSKVGKDVTPIPIPVDQLLTNALGKACGLLQAQAPSADTDIHVGDTYTFPYGPFTIRTGDPAVSSDGTLLRYDLWKTNSADAPYLSISVVVLTDFAQALSWLITYLGSIVHTSDAVWDITSDDVRVGQVLLSPKSGINFGATIQSNVLVILEGTAETSILSEILSSVNGFMTPFHGKPLTEVDLSQCQLEGVPSSLDGQQAFNLTLTAPGTIDVSVASNTKAIHPQTTKLKLNPGQQTYTWYINCVMFANSGYIKKGRELAVSFAAENTWYTTTKKFPIGT
ncbi:hypothetical protein TWF281_009580 [Arthrobotrys megalospora]